MTYSLRVPAYGEARTCVALELMAVRTFAMAVAPLAPWIGEQLAAGLGKPLGVPAE
ncbi:hypothetical protein [Actinomadura alba]|uniref:hypothetical protein n=1 Tax=Actinomadura alba TaxID=406431 RepID=UPI0031DCD67B